MSTEDAEDLRDTRPPDPAIRSQVPDAPEPFAVFDQLPSGVLVVDAAGRPLFLNRAGHAILGVPPGEPVPSLGDAWPFTPVLERVLTGEPVPPEDVCYRRPGAAADQWLQVTAARRPAARGASAGAILVFVDVTPIHLQQQDVALSEARWRLAVTNAPLILFTVDRHGIFTMSEGRSLAALDQEPGQAVGLSAFHVYRDVPAILDGLRRALAGDAVTRIVEVAGTVFDVNYLPLRDRNGAVSGAIGVATDITEGWWAIETLRRSEERFRALSEQSTDLVAILDANGIFAYASPSHERIMGYSPEQLEGRSALDLVHPDDRAVIETAFAAAELQPDSVKGAELRMRHADGSWRTLESIGNNRLHDPTVRGFVVNSRDITERKQMEAALQHLARYDPLTGLPNRTLLLDRLRQGLQARHHDPQPLALLLLDLDRFKEVNDTFGHQHGDLLLQQVGQRLSATVRPSATVARLGGDEFAIFLPGTDQAAAVETAHRIQAALEATFSVEGEILQVGGSIGIVICPEHGADTATLLRRADVAMYAAKHSRQGHAVYAEKQDRHSPQRHALIGALRQTIESGGLVLYFQPMVTIATEEVFGMEALVRWRHPEHGLIPPDQFVPLAEQTGLIVPLTRWVLEAALRQCRAWSDAGRRLVTQVNLSMANLHDPQLAETITRLLEQYGVPPTALRLELTESTIMDDAVHSLEMLTLLAALHIGIAVDDFGTGYSSLAYLKRLPVDEIKIDKSFVLNMARDPTDSAIVRSTIGLGRGLDLRVVAEGVENRETWDLLAALGCDAGQGYYLGRPLPAADLDRWLAAWRGIGGPAY